jgi:uncharacterized protein YlzI (FlbEa/FlbD family)
MDIRLVRVNDHNGQPVFINPQHVALLKSNGETTMVYVAGNSNPFTIKGKVDALAKALSAVETET